ncbi:serine hydrolase domain-containing protein [Paenibacillus sp. 2TAB19]|uniref:serine hydrolase domain-containing protein n=1 Tax=Paenibacillus sp. 2TAB19 TaxID=3233003 RepID=UPI003F971489
MGRHDGQLLKLEDRMRRSNVPGIGVAVIRDGYVEWSESWGVLEAGGLRPIDADSLFHACSMSKMVTAIGVLRLVQDGLLDAESDVNRYLTSWQVSDNTYTDQEKVTVASLLAHHAGIVDPDGSFDVHNGEDDFPSPKQLLSGHTAYNPDPVEVRQVPSSRFSYSDAGYTVLEQLIEDITGESFASAVNRLVIEPLELKRTLFWNGETVDGEYANARFVENAAAGHDKNGCLVVGKKWHYPNLSGAGLWTTPAEFAALTLEIIRAWEGSVASILRPDLARAMLTSYGLAPGVGLGVFLPDAAGMPCFFSQGWGVGYQCKMVSFPSLKSGIVVMMNAEPGKHQDESLVGEVIREVSEEYGWPII